jgi:hypothetical protein
MEVSMPLSMLLYVLYLKLWWASRNNPVFKSYIGTIRLRVLIKTADGKRGRLFVFDRGKLTSKSGANHACDAALVFTDVFTALKVMISGSDRATFKAAAKGKVKVEGMAFYIQWFNDGVKLVM